MFTLSSNALQCILSHTVGVVGYFEGQVTGVVQTEDRIIVNWRWAGSDRDPLVFDHQGQVIR